ncbi:angiopoietin-related protein 4-like isoform X2 [Drosophila albomicans]|uniref:Angiopoietin-related protein 4-like isoform X2 n=1 Tax=Drosophila albomicans TaxID=7291 RepID=A0A9C6T2Z6_DROAB|nr:angiopoietin-related protein 4-like isoform X2 [Drosophila albomicans]
MGRITFNRVFLLMVLQIFLVATTTGDEKCESDRKMEEQCRLHNYKTVKPLLDYFRQVRNEIEQSETKEKQISELNSDLMEKYREIVRIHETFMKEAALLNEYKNKVNKGENDLQLCQNKVDKSESEINSKQNTILNLEEQLSDKSTNLENCQVQLKSFNSSLIEKDENIKALNSRLIEKDENIKRFSENIKNKTEHQKALELELEKSKSISIKNENDIQLCRSEINELNRTSENIREEQKKIQLKLKESETKLIDKEKDKSTNLENCQVQLKSLNSRLIERDENIKIFSENIKNNTEHQKKLELKFEKSKSTLIKQKKLIQLCRSEINELNRTLENNREEQKKIQLKLTESETKLIDKVKDNQLCQSELDKLTPTTCIPFGDYSGVHQLNVSGIGLFDVLCDSQLAGPGWIVIQERVGGNESFTRDWATYRKGFGSFQSDFFLGLEKLHRITSLQRLLYIHLVAENERTYNARYDDFKISDEDNGYALSLGKFNGTIVDSMRYNENMKFSTFDHDNDNADDDNCAIIYESGWWYNYCSTCNLNAPYEDLHWYNIEYIFIKEVKMLIRPKEEMKK